jgi:hypothetical protein
MTAAGNSLGTLVLMTRMEERPAVKISLPDVSHARTPSQAAALRELLG